LITLLVSGRPRSKRGTRVSTWWLVGEIRSCTTWPSANRSQHRSVPHRSRLPSTTPIDALGRRHRARNLPNAPPSTCCRASPVHGRCRHPRPGGYCKGRTPHRGDGHDVAPSTAAPTPRSSSGKPRSGCFAASEPHRSGIRRGAQLSCGQRATTGANRTRAYRIRETLEPRFKGHRGRPRGSQTTRPSPARQGRRASTSPGAVWRLQA